MKGYLFLNNDGKIILSTDESKYDSSLEALIISLEGVDTVKSRRVVDKLKTKLN